MIIMRKQEGRVKTRRRREIFMGVGGSLPSGGVGAQFVTSGVRGVLDVAERGWRR